MQLLPPHVLPKIQTESAVQSWFKIDPILLNLEEFPKSYFDSISNVIRFV